jgi:hypothetical protein
MEAEVWSTYLTKGPRASGDVVTGPFYPPGHAVRTRAEAKSDGG